MSASLGIVGKGTTIGYSAYPTPTTYTTIAEVTGEIPFPTIQVDGEVDLTNFTSPNSFTEKKASGWLTSDTLEIELTYVEAVYVALLALVGTDQTFKITLPDTHTIIFGAYINKLAGKAPNKDRITSTITLTVKSLPVIA